MYCSLDKIDLAATVDGRVVAVQTDHRGPDEIADRIELSVLCAMTRVINARERGDTVYYVISRPPELLGEALHAVGAVISDAESWTASAHLPTEPPPVPSEERAGELADHCFAGLANRVAARTGTRDLAVALHMLETETLAAPPSLDDPASYWQRVLELAALTGELLRTKASHLGAVGHWVQTDRALVPFGFELTTPSGTTTIMFPTNRAQRVIEDGGGESLLKLLIAAEETLERPPDAATGRLMPSLRDRRDVEVDEVVWQPLLAENPRVELPIVVCGIDGESTFGMIRREALQREPDDAMAEALANLIDEEVEIGELLDQAASQLRVIGVTGSFYAAEKLLDPTLLLRVHAMLDAERLLAGVPARGVLLVAADGDSARTRFATLVRDKHEAAGGRAISRGVWIVERGRVVGVEPDTVHVRRDTAPIRAETTREGIEHDDGPDDKDRPVGILRRILGRK